MATRDELLTLAERCEREEPSPELDAAILIACGHAALNRGTRMGWEWRPNNTGIWRSMPSPTTSLDAAVTLVPDGMNFGIEFDANANHPGGATVADFRLADVPERYGRAKTPALALCAAALRARAAMVTP